MFGSKPAFGASSTTSTFGSGTSLFGQNKPATGLFGQPAQQQQQSTSLFGAKPAGTSLFGQSTTTNATGIFGSPAANTSSGGLFGQSKPSLFGASTSNSSFGQTSTSLFGSSSPSTTSMFGASAAAPNGTTVKFEPLIGSDTMQKNGTNQTINTKHMCITAMKQYESKSIEELRVEDYIANRKTPTTGQASGGGLFGSSTTTSGTGLFGASSTPSKSIFGSTSAGTSAFGAPASTASTSLFGSPSTTTGTSLFGAKPAGTSLFGAAQPAAGTTSVFGSPATSTGTSLFGQPAATTTSAFGQPAATGGTSLFGAPATSTASSGFSFGAPAATSTASAFGSSFGQPAATTGTSLFGQPAATAGTSLFGQPAATASPFGQTAQPAAGGLFGAKPATTFGAPAAGGLFGAPAAQPAATGLFGAAAQPATSAFGATAATAAPVVQQVAVAPIEIVTNVSQAQVEMAMINAYLSANPYGDSSLLNVKRKEDTDEYPNPISRERQMRFIASKRAESESLLSKSANGGGGATKNLLASVLDIPVGAPAPKSRQSLVTKDLEYNLCFPSPTLGRGIRNGSAMRNSSFFNKTRGSNRSMINDSVEASVEAALRSNTNQLVLPSARKQHIKFLDPDATRDPDELPHNERTTANDGQQLRGENNILSPLAGIADGALAREATLRKHQPPTLNLDTTVDRTEVSPMLAGGGFAAGASPAPGAGAAGAVAADTFTVSPQRAERRAVDVDVKEVAGTGVRLVSPDYYTIPSLDAMKDMVHNGKVVLADGLTVGRHTYGTVFWSGSLELSNVTLDEIIVFRHKEVTVYPDETVKPPLGVEFNRPAEITLERVWPYDKTSKEPIKDSAKLVNMGWRDKLEGITVRMDADFMDYRPASGSWVFRVKHFSKYGLPADDDDEEMADQSMKENIVQDKVQRARVQLKTGEASGAKAATAALPQRTSLAVSDSEIEEVLDDAADIEAAAMRRAEERIASLGAGARRAMNAGLGGNSSYLLSPEARTAPSRGVTLGYTGGDGYSEDMDHGEEEDNGYGNTENRSILSGMDAGDGDMRDDWRRTAVPDKKIKMEKIDQEVYMESNRLRNLLQQPLPFGGKSTVELVERAPVREFADHAPAKDGLRRADKTGLVDQTAAHGVSARVGWAAGGVSVVSLLPFQNSVAIGLRQFSEDYTPEYVTDMLEHNQRLSHLITRHRSSSNRAKHCELDEDVPNAPRIKPTSDYSQLIHSFLATAHQSGRPREALVWELCDCLWPADRGQTPSWEWTRRERVGAWAIKAAASADERGVAVVVDNRKDRGAKVWAELSRGNLEAAIDQAIEEGLVVLASLLAIFVVDPDTTRADFERQVDEWSRSGALDRVPRPLAKCYLTMAGRTHAGPATGLNCLDGLQWPAALGLCGLWYDRRNTTLDECLARLEEEAVAGRVRLPPLNVHLELMRLCVDRTRSIERVLDSVIENSLAPNDFHLAWYLWSMTRAVGLPQMDESAEHALHVAHAEQLIATGLPHFALFVLAHISNAQCRNLAMREVIDRCALMRQSVDYGRVMEMCRIPEEWIEWARYLVAKSEGDVHMECEQALKAGEYALAHRLFVTEVAPDLLCDASLEALDNLCQQFESVSEHIPGWGAGGQLYSDYIELKALENDDNDDLEKLVELKDSIQSKLLLDERSTPLEQLAKESMNREMIELTIRLGGAHVVEGPLDPKGEQELVVRDIEIPIDY